jgi:histidine triad (HIT) family protein
MSSVPLVRGQLFNSTMSRFLQYAERRGQPEMAVRKGQLTTDTAMMTDNLFKKIIDRQLKADIVYEDDRCLAFRDINPQAPVHVLIIPKKVIATHADLSETDRDLLGHLHLTAVKLANQLGIADGYRLVVNCKEKAGQTVPHLHFHLLGGRDLHWPPG